MQLKPIKPYLLKAYYSWITDSWCTPYLLAQASLPHVVVPAQYIDKEDQTILLNLAPVAIQNLEMTEHQISFQARFDGVVWDILIPNYAVLGLYPQEANEDGVFFELDQQEITQDQEYFVDQKIPAKSSAQKKNMAGRPNLRVITNPNQEA